MKVQGSDPLGRLRDILTRLDEAEKGDRAAKPGDATSPPVPRDLPVISQDDARFSVKAQEVQRLREELDNSPEVRQELVERLRHDIASGQYRIDGVRIAGAMIEQDRELSAADRPEPGEIHKGRFGRGA